MAVCLIIYQLTGIGSQLSAWTAIPHWVPRNVSTALFPVNSRAPHHVANTMQWSQVDFVCIYQYICWQAICGVAANSDSSAASWILQ